MCVYVCVCVCECVFVCVCVCVCVAMHLFIDVSLLNSYFTKHILVKAMLDTVEMLYIVSGREGDVIGLYIIKHSCLKTLETFY